MKWLEKYSRLKEWKLIEFPKIDKLKKKKTVWDKIVSVEGGGKRCMKLKYGGDKATACLDTCL